MSDSLEIAGRVLFLAGCVLFSVLLYLVGFFAIYWLADQMLLFFVNSGKLSEGWATFVLALLMTTVVPFLLAKLSLSVPNYKASELVAIFFCLTVAVITVISIFYLIFFGPPGNIRLLYVAPLVHFVSAITGAIHGGFAKGR